MSDSRENLSCDFKVCSELQCPAVLPQESTRLWSSVTMTRLATWEKVKPSHTLLPNISPSLVSPPLHVVFLPSSLSFHQESKEQLNI